MIEVKTGSKMFRVGGGVVSPKVNSFPVKDPLVGPKRAAPCRVAAREKIYRERIAQKGN